VKVVDYEIETKTDENGEFVLYFNEIKNNNIKIEIEKNGGQIPPIDKIIEEGKTKFLGKIVFPDNGLIIRYNVKYRRLKCQEMGKKN